MQLTLNHGTPNPIQGSTKRPDSSGTRSTESAAGYSTSPNSDAQQKLHDLVGSLLETSDPNTIKLHLESDSVPIDSDRIKKEYSPELENLVHLLLGNDVENTAMKNDLFTAAVCKIHAIENGSTGAKAAKKGMAKDFLTERARAIEKIKQNDRRFARRAEKLTRSALEKDPQVKRQKTSQATFEQVRPHIKAQYADQLDQLYCLHYNDIMIRFNQEINQDLAGFVGFLNVGSCSKQAPSIKLYNKEYEVEKELFDIMHQTKDKTEADQRCITLLNAKIAELKEKVRPVEKLSEGQKYVAVDQDFSTEEKKQVASQLEADKEAFSDQTLETKKDNSVKELLKAKEDAFVAQFFVTEENKPVGELSEDEENESIEEQSDDESDSYLETAESESGESECAKEVREINEGHH